jgi:flagellar biosynthesis protein FlhA
MPPTASANESTRGSTLRGLILPVALVGGVLVFVVPIPSWLLDILLSLNITIAVIVLLTTTAVRTPMEFSTFPTILLASTLSRLVLNVATTRLVLTKGGTEGVQAAGGVVRAFGEFVAGDQLVVGVILFTILVVIQFVVITQGSTRISEVAARFMLDGLPGRQMAIDADLHSGLIDQAQANRRREQVYQQADFFGAMDGASRFVRGDAVAGVVILIVNILGGLYLGVVEHGMSVPEAVGVFTKLTIGDGLVSQAPAFLIALASGLIVTRSSAAGDLSGAVTNQLFSRPRVLAMAAVFVALLALAPLPRLPLLILAVGLAAGAYILAGRPEPAGDELEPEPVPQPARARVRSTRPVPARKTADSALGGRPTPTAGEPVAEHGESILDKIDELLHVDPLELVIGFRLIGLADPERGGDLLARLKTVRQRIAREMGLIVPQVRIHDELALPPNEYRFKIRGVVVAQGTAYAGRLLATPPSGLVTRPDGRDGIDPTTGQPAVWIHADGREVAELAGCRILETSSVIAEHFGQVVTDHADLLLTHELVERLLERVRASSPALVAEVVPGLIRSGELRRILQNLLRERVSIRDLETILETLAVHAGKTRDVDQLTELVRLGLARRIIDGYKGSDGRLRVVTLERSIDDRLSLAAGMADTRPALALGDDTARNIIQAVALAVSSLIEAGLPPIIVTSAQARAVLKDLTRADLPRLVVLSQREIPRDTPVEVMGSVVEEPTSVVTTYATTGALV